MKNANSQVKFGPLQESGQITAGLDYYKPTMSQLAHNKQPNLEVTYTFKNRGSQRLLDYVNTEQLQQRFEYIAAKGWDKTEIDYLASICGNDGAIFTQQFLQYLQENILPPVNIGYDQTTNDLCFGVNGPWTLATFWETIVMSEVNEAYFEHYLIKNNINPLDAYEEGNRRLSEKIETLKANPGIKFADFGTRRHFSLRWQKHVIERLINECPDNLVGTSNVALANTFDIKPIGTFAHEMPMVYAGVADATNKDIKSTHDQFLEDWYAIYGNDYSIALTDTFTTDFFLADFSAAQAESWRGIRHDSGNPFEFGDKFIEFYKSKNIDPTTKTIVFSDGLDIDTIVALYNYFSGQINCTFGWGTTLTNDLGIKPLNIVMKATHVQLPDTDQQADTVKLSDDSGKNTGPPSQINRYKDIFKIASNDKS